MPVVAKTKADKDRLLQRIEDLHVRGATQMQIAKAVGVSQPRVSMLLDEIKRGWVANGPYERTELVVELEKRYQWIFFEANKAWERSKKDKQEIIIEEPLLSMIEEAVKLKGKKKRDKEDDLKDALRRLKRASGRKTTKVSGRIPAAQFLQVMNDINKAIREMHGIDAPTKVQAQVATINWAEIAAAAQKRDTPERLIEKLTTEQFPDAVEADEYEGTDMEGQQL